jgi:hypothetical protein
MAIFRLNICEDARLHQLQDDPSKFRRETVFLRDRVLISSQDGLKFSNRLIETIFRKF